MDISALQGNVRYKKAPSFAPPRVIKFDSEEREKLARMVVQEYESDVQARKSQSENHLLYDQMFRGNLPERSWKPWPGSADLHVQMPYWLVDAINVRFMIGIWNQNPLVTAIYEEADDAKVAEKAAKLAEWDLQPSRMNARHMWNRMSKTRLIHGVGIGLISYVNDTYKYRTVTEAEGQDPIYIGDDESGRPQYAPALDENVVEGTYYQGPTLFPLDWDDVVVPIGCMNLQPNRPSNPGGAHRVILRMKERLSLMKQKSKGKFGGSAAYEHLFEKGERDDEWWLSRAPPQDGSSVNNERQRQADQNEGVNRSYASRERSKDNPNPEYEILTRFGVYRDPDTDEEEEMILFVSYKPEVFLGAFFLSDVCFRGDRPLLELHYQTVGSRFYSMGVMEIVRHLSAELDTLHNMRIDVGFATNLPFFFYRASSGFNPDEVTLRPLKGIPVDNPDDFRFPQIQSVTSFYYQEEMLLFTLVERVMGITDLFLGVSPTRGASARHATGFVGTQMEAEARMSEILNQDAESFSFLCRMVYNLEMQYGPVERRFRLLGDSTDTLNKVGRNDLWFEGEYDFRLGANTGFFSHTIKQQQGQALQQLAASSPLISGNLARRWESDAFYLRSIGFRDPEQFIGPKSAIEPQEAMSQGQENGQMAQYQFGEGVPSPTHPNDNDQEHMKQLMEFMSSDAYNSLSRPNEMGFYAHAQLHQQQMGQKQAQQQAQAQMAMQAPPGGNGTAPTPGQGANPMNRAAAQIANVPAAGGSMFGEALSSMSGNTPQRNQSQGFGGKTQTPKNPM